MDRLDPLLVRAIRTAEKRATRLDSVSDDFAPAMRTFRSQSMDGAFKAVEIMGNTIDNNLQVLVVIISTDLTAVHDSSFSRLRVLVLGLAPF